MAGRRGQFAGARMRVWRRTLTTLTAAATALVVAAPLATASGVSAYLQRQAEHHGKPPVVKGVGRKPLQPLPAIHPSGRPLSFYHPSKPAWPAAGIATASLLRTPESASASASASASPSVTAAAKSAHASATTGTAAPSGATIGSTTASTVPRTSPSASSNGAGALVTGPVQAGSLPVWVGPAPHVRASDAALQPTSVRVQMASHTQTLRAGADGMLFGLTRGDGSRQAAKIQVVIDYSGLAKAYGGGYGSRLQVFLVPACALTTPQIQACRSRTPVSFTNRAGSAELIGALSLGATTDSATASRSLTRAQLAPMTSSSSSMTMVEVTSGNQGSQGNYAATSLNPSGTWQASGTGSYDYTYPIDVPAAVGGLGPSVALGYDSQSVDGETSARNSQASWIGDGWSYQPGFVERTYQSCGSLLDSSGNHVLKGSGDQCWTGQNNATLSFGSHSGVLIPVPTTVSAAGVTQQWALQGDDGTIVQELSGASNGVFNGEYFRVLTQDGSVAYFGAGHAPTGPGASGTVPATPTDTSTNSAWGVPVLHPITGDPCYNSTDGTASKCSANEGWRWNLDFVVSPTGFVQRYDYTTETNYYDMGGGQVAASNGSGTITPYTRDGQLSTISYGYLLGDEQAGHNPAARVVFKSGNRCQPGTGVDCSQPLSSTTATNWPDVPYDLNCNATDSPTLPAGSTTVPAGVCITYAPTFWSTNRLDSITTQVNMAGTMTPVDSYQLQQVYSDAGGTADPVTGTTQNAKDVGELQAVMWLQQITHTGHDAAGNTVTLNPVSFTGKEIDNRVNDASPAAPPLYRPRISSIQTETGGQITVNYNETPCAGLTLVFGLADINTNSCYPVYWTPAGDSKPLQDWFNKITVKQVVISDLTAASSYSQGGITTPGSRPQEYDYSYSGAAWHRDDSALTDDQYRTWDQFRGFHTVTVTTGTAPDPITQQTTTYLQGMDGDYLADGTQRHPPAVTDNAGGSTIDSNWLAGTALETDTYTKAGGTIAEMSVSHPVFVQTASVTQTPWTDWNTTDDPGQTQPTLSTLPPLTAHRISTVTSTSYSLLSGGTTWRQNSQTTSYDSNSRVVSVDSTAKDDTLGGTASPLQETCATTGYAAPPASNTLMLTYPDRTTVVTGACGGSSPTLLSDKKLYYDGAGTLTNLPTFGQLGAAGEMTATSIATASSGGTATAWRTTAAMAYDGAGRVYQTTVPDPTGAKPAGLVTTTTFSPAWKSTGDNANPTTITSTNDPGWKTVSTLDPLRGLATENVDANGRITDIAYDALGRRTAVWLPGRSKATQSADETFAYSINPGAVHGAGGSVYPQGAPSSVTTNTLKDDGTYATSVQIYDGMLQPRQLQTSQPGDTNQGRLISDTFYDSHGWPSIAYAPYTDKSNGTTPVYNPPSSTLYPAQESDIVSETATTYDGMGRPIKQTQWHNAILQWGSTTTHDGADHTTETPPAGGATTQAFTDALGQTIKTVVNNTNGPVTLTGGQIIPSGTSLMSGSVRLTMLASGDLSLTSLSSGAQLWHSGTSSAGAYAVFGTDGNLAVYDTTGTSKWTTGRAATTGSTLKLQDDGNLVIYTSTGAAAWSTGTSQASADPTTTYTYTPAGQVSTIKDSAGNQWSYHYNLLGQKTDQTDPNTGTTTFDSYDVDGNLTQTTDPRGQKLGYQYDWDNRMVAEFDLNKPSTPAGANELAAWTYDQTPDSTRTNPTILGYASTATRYVGGTSGTAYTNKIDSYNERYQPDATDLSIPASDGFAPAGSSVAPTSGQTTYTLGANYTPGIGQLSMLTYQADGGLPQEQVTYTYNQQGDLSGIGSGLGSGTAYLAYTVHDMFGRVTEADWGPAAKQLVASTVYDETTGRVVQTRDQIQGAATTLDLVNYRYNQAGELTAVDDYQDNTTHDTQCFSYDSLQRLTQAWTDTKYLADADPTTHLPNSSPVGGIGSCTTASPTTTTTAPVATTTVGGPAPYWQSYTYDLLGDRTGMVNHDPTGNATNNLTQTIAYPGADGTTPAAHPNQATSTSTSSPGQGASTQSAGYVDASGANAGNTMTRTISTGPLLAGVKSTNSSYINQQLCAADNSGSSTPGTYQMVWPCSGGTAQNYTLNSDGTLKVEGQCLDTTGSATAAGTIVVINTCSGSATQKWTQGTNGTLVNSGANLCLTDPTANTVNGTKLTIAACGNPGQNWTTVSASRTQLTSAPLHSGLNSTSTNYTGQALCAADDGNYSTAGTYQMVWPCTGGPAQNYAPGSDGTLKVAGMCLDTTNGSKATGTIVVINTCNSATTTQKWSLTSTGTIVNTGANLCLTDPSGNTLNGTKLTIAACGTTGQTWTTVTTTSPTTLGQSQTFTYDAEGRTATVTVTGGNNGNQTSTSSYLYDATGNLLEQSTTIGSNTQRILYLFGGAEQITLNVLNKSWTALRHYTGPDGTIATRSTGNANNGTVSYEVAGYQGTSTLAVDASTLTPTRRYYDPYGNPRGAVPGTWASNAGDENRGFLGQPTDTNAALNLLGARTYDPTQGRFTSPDPVFEAGDPNQMGGYTYAGDNPSTGSDPTGLMNYQLDLNDGVAVVQFPTSDPASGNAVDYAAGAVDTTIDIADGMLGGGMAPFHHWIANQVEGWLGVNKSTDTYRYGGDSAFLGSLFFAPEAEGERLAASGGESLASRLRNRIAQALDHGSGVADASGAEEEAAQKALGAQAAAKNAQHDAEAAAQDANKAVQKPAGPGKGSSAGKDPSSGGSPGCSGCRCSFSPDTPVLMSDGTTKAIGTLKVGDKVESADPNTGKEQGGRAVQHIWINHDTDLLDVTVRDGHGHASVIHTTANHPFWDDTTHTWVRADHLKAGHKLASTSGQHPTVVNTRVTPGAANRWNLTVQQLHTYYVVAGGVPILVHNANLPEVCGPITKNTHFADVEVYDAQGTQIDSYSLRSGATTPEEASLGVGRARQAVHTENRAARASGGAPMIGEHEIAGDPFWGASPVPEGGLVRITGTRPPCGNCQGQMRLSSEDTGATFEYLWPDGNGGMNVWSSDDY